MPLAQDPVVEKRRLRLALRKLREEANFTQREVADALDWSREKVLRIEKGAVSVHPTDVRDLLRLYKVTKQEDVDHFVEMARVAKQPGWSEYKDVYAQDYVTYLGYEAASSTMRQYHPTLVPGLLQTEEYAQEILTKVHENSPERVERLVNARLRRQELFEGNSGPEFRIIIDEAALRRPVGSVRVMRAQLRRLKEIAQRNRVTLMFLPLSAGAHPGVRGPFILLEFDDPLLDDVLFMENPRGDYLTRDDPESTTRYFQLFNDLEKLSLTAPEFDTMISEIAGEDLAEKVTGAERSRHL
jgi:transcriptional regulator with XRE-family HTH domain